MNLDSFFTKGDSHKICEDYAIHGETDQYAYIILCDGCSSSPKVDIGARMLADVFAAEIQDFDIDFYVKNHFAFWPIIFYQTIYRNVKTGLKKIAFILKLEPSVFDATLLAAICIKSQNQILTLQWGDGRITTAYKDGYVTTASIIYSLNAPAYFSYQVWEDRQKEYQEHFKDQTAVFKKTLTGEKDILIKNTPANVDWLSAENVQYIHLTSDGIDSFQDANDNKIDVAEEFTKFKSFEGEFVQRRMNRLIKDTRKEGGGFYDDLGVAAIAFN